MKTRTSTNGNKMADLLKKDTLTTTEAAKLLGLSVMQVTREFHDGKLRGWRKTDAPNAQIFIYRESVLEFAEKIQGRSLIKPAKRSRR